MNEVQKDENCLFHPDFFVKLVFEIAVDQQTRACDRTFEGVHLIIEHFVYLMYRLDLLFM